MKKNIQILAVTPQIAKNGNQYHKIETSAGTMSCFEEAVVTKLKYALGKPEVCVDVVEKGSFTNIREFYGQKDLKVQEPETKGDEAIKQRPQPPTPPFNTNKQTTMYTSYAKDVFIALINKETEQLDEKTVISKMNDAVTLVKIARDAF